MISAMDGNMLALPAPPEQSAESTKNTWFLLGICGAGMKSLCELLLEQGVRVAGSDQDSVALKQLHDRSAGQVQTFAWESCHSMAIRHQDTVVRSIAVAANSPQAQYAAAMTPRILTLPEALANLFSQSRQLCVAGTHGKTTTAGMLWWILSQSGAAAARYLGGELCGSDVPELPKTWDSAVIESCEYRDSFLSLSPSICVLNSIEPDHFDWFGSLQQMEASFSQFVQRVRPGGSVITNADCDVSVAIAGKSGASVISYAVGLGRNADFGILNHRQATGMARRPSAIGSGKHNCRFSGQTFVLQQSTGAAWSIRLAVPGLHNCQNAAAAFLAARQMGLPAAVIQQHLATFPGMRRRFEYRGTWRGADLIDDYAHHPTAVRATAETARAVFPDRRLVAVFEPHQISRATTLMPDFARALSRFDEVFVLPVLSVREQDGEEKALETSIQLIQTIKTAGGRASLVKNLDQVPATLDYSVQPGDVILTMGAGRTHTIHDEIHRRLQRDTAA